jgi:alkanesulfonate monooxygenase SsuD/methylene tetrahydromethanopterin reductase-like flavin-dependent oxidoreductase (luciferase family)
VQQLDSLSSTIDEARLAEELGYDSVWLFEHHGVDRPDGGSHYFSSPLIVLAAIAAVTRRVELGTGIVILPLLPPVRVVEDAMLVQAISNGRLILGVGTGYRPEEFAAFGIPFSERTGRMAESLEIVERLLAEKRVDHSGRYFTLDDVSVVGAAALPPPPLWVGGWAPGAVRRAARYGQAWIAGLTGDQAKVASCIELYLAEREKHANGAPPRLAVEREVFVGNSAQELDEARTALHDLYLEEHVAWRHPNVPSGDAPSFAELAAGRFLVGTPAEVREQVMSYAELGVTDLLCRMHYPGISAERARSSMETFAREVAPGFSA